MHHVECKRINASSFFAIFFISNSNSLKFGHSIRYLESIRAANQPATLQSEANGSRRVLGESSRVLDRMLAMLRPLLELVVARLSIRADQDAGSAAAGLFRSGHSKR